MNQADVHKKFKEEINSLDYEVSPETQELAAKLTKKHAPAVYKRMQERLKLQEKQEKKVK